MDVVPNPETTELLVIMENGLGKMSKVTDYRFQGRGGSGVKTANVTEKTGKVVGAKTIEKGMDADLILMSKSGQTIRMHTGNIPSQGRATQGVYLMRLRPKDKVASLSLVEVSEDNENPELQSEIEQGTEQAEAIATPTEAKKA